MWAPICTSEEHGSGTSDVQSHQTHGSKSVAVCAREPERQTDTQASGLDSLIKAKCWLTPLHLQCHKLPTQPARPCLLSADNIHLLFQLIKYETRKHYFSSWVSASQHNTHSATAFLCPTWSRKLFDRPNLLCLFTVFTSLHFRSFTCSCTPDHGARERCLAGAPSAFSHPWEVSLSPEDLQMSHYSHKSQMFHFIYANQTDNKERDLWKIYE